MRKNIYIDITSFFNTDFMSGIQRVVREVTIRLLKMPELNVVLFTWKNDERDFTLIDTNDYLKCYDEGTISKKEIRTKGKLRSKALSNNDVFFDIDALWNNNCHARKDVYSFLREKNITIISYIYDIIPITHPEFWGKFLDLGFYDYIAANLRYSDTLITSANATVSELSILTNKLGISLPNCEVSWLGSDFKKNNTGEVISDKAKFAVSKGKYILCVGTIEPRKNHQLVLDAYDKKLSELGINLIFAGRRGWNVDDLLNQIDTHPNKDNGFWFLENENDTTIQYLYQNAFAVVFPTFDEGFGLPLVEALLNGTICFVSDIPVMREVGGEICEYFNPHKSSELTDLIEKYSTHQEIYENRQKIVKNYKSILWDEVVKKIKNTLISQKKDCIREKKMKEINVAQIMQEIRKEIAEKGYKDSDLEFSRIPVNQNDVLDLARLNNAIATANATYRIDMYAPIHDGKCKTFIKKVIRKFIRPIFMTQAHRQTTFNENTLLAIRQLEQYASELEKRIEKLEQNKR